MIASLVLQAHIVINRVQPHHLHAMLEHMWRQQVKRCVQNALLEHIQTLLEHPVLLSVPTVPSDIIVTV